MKHRFEVLDIFRGLFASMVVFFHLAPFADTPLLNNQFVDNSDMFVDFFFVLSGFVIAYNYKSMTSGSQFAKFFRKRLYRIYPLHFIMLMAFLVVEVSKGFLASYVHVNNPVSPNNNPLTFFTSLLLINSVKLGGVSDVSWNIPSWSISAEMISYLVFGLLMVALHKLAVTRFKTAAFLGVVLVAAASLVLITDSLVLNYSFDFGFLRGIIGFFVGAFCYGVFDRCFLFFQSLGRIVFHVLEAAVLLAIVGMIYNGPVLKDIGLVYEFMFFTSILVFSFEKGFISHLLKKSGFLKRVGTYSYSIYMTHALLISIFNIVFIRVLKFPPSAYSYLVFLNYLLIYFVSRWTYHNIELRFKDTRQVKPSETHPVNT